MAALFTIAAIQRKPIESNEENAPLVIMNEISEVEV